jgi:GT2 family glycosyltransferase
MPLAAEGSHLKSPTREASLYDLSIVIVSFNTRDVLRCCLEHLYEAKSTLALEIIVVDNASKDGTVQMLADEYPEVRVICSDSNLGFAGANNRALTEAQGRYFVLLNSDAFLPPDALQLAVEHMDHNPQVGLGGGRLVGRDGDWQPSARTFPGVVDALFTMSGLSTKYAKSRIFGRADRTFSDPMIPAEVDWVPGAFSIIRPEILKEVGLFDEQFFLYYEEVDLCRRIKECGHKIMYWPDIQVVHLGGESSKTVPEAIMSKAGSQLTLWRMRSELLYHRKHGGSIGVFLAYHVECLWHRVRRLRNLMQAKSDSSAKAAESRTVIELKKRAWKETDGGRISPPRPW